MKFKETKELVLAHTRAKLLMYEQYLTIYLSIMSNTPFYINLFDPFCGNGIYRDGKKGSAIITYDCVKENYNKMKSINKEYSKDKITMYLNDINVTRIHNVEKILTEKQAKSPICNIEFSNTLYSELVDELIQDLKMQNKFEHRNLLFIDPYGYKNIFKKHIEEILSFKNSEIVLFLPITFIYRFMKISFKDYENSKYDKVRKFISDFFESPEELINSTPNVTTLIEHLRYALTFDNQFYCCTYTIKKDHTNNYALFIITPHIYGFEKILEVQWKCDEAKGSGYDFSKEDIIPLFCEYEKEVYLETFKKRLIDFIRVKKTNKDLYEFTLQNLFLPKHLNKILKLLQKKEIIKVIDIESGKSARKNSFYANYKNYKDRVYIEYVKE